MPRELERLYLLSSAFAITMGRTCPGKPPKEDERHVERSQASQPSRLRQVKPTPTLCAQTLLRQAKTPRWAIWENKESVTGSYKAKAKPYRDNTTCPRDLTSMLGRSTEIVFIKAPQRLESCLPTWERPLFSLPASWLYLSKWILHSEPGFHTMTTHLLYQVSNQQKVRDLKTPCQLRKNDMPYIYPTISNFCLRFLGELCIIRVLSHLK